MRAAESISLGRSGSHAALRCRCCGAEVRHTFVDLGMSPLANSFLEVEQLDRMEPFYPLHAMVCGECFLVQLREFETPDRIFSDYAYFSSFSQSWLDHARDYVDRTTDRLELGSHSRVVEIGSNDGYLLQFFVAKGIPAFGVEPAANVARAALERGVPTRVAFFSRATALRLAAEGIAADLIIANNVLAQVPTLDDFVAGIAILLRHGGLVNVEVPHLLRLIEDHQFDTIYHEHFSYFSLGTLIRVFAHQRLEIFDVEELTTHGGSLRIHAGHAGAHAVTPRVDALLRREGEAGLASLAPYLAFADKAAATKRALLRFLSTAKEEGKSVVGYGAPAKGNTLLNYCGIRADFIDYVVDCNPRKQGRFLPGTHIPILDTARIAETCPDYLLILPWNLRDEITARMTHVREWGCRFVTPIPTVRLWG